MLEEIENFPPPSLKGKYIRIKYVTQLPSKTPTFAFYCNLPQYVKEPYKRFLENKIREHWKFTGVPIQIFKNKKMKTILAAGWFLFYHYICSIQKIILWQKIQ